VRHVHAGGRLVAIGSQVPAIVSTSAIAERRFTTGSGFPGAQIGRAPTAPSETPRLLLYIGTNSPERPVQSGSEFGIYEGDDRFRSVIFCDHALGRIQGWNHALDRSNLRNPVFLP